MRIAYKGRLSLWLVNDSGKCPLDRVGDDLVNPVKGNQTEREVGCAEVLVQPANNR